ncbi:hypothetical protein EQG49_05710 [Periweissella cryptocerci]|uniref:Lipoprotein n=1 Tax=Periweissella cryptocerci TaxID=2506420 RepID=A0A4P6YTH5_9LACO|nr:hypothetical protein [Periweissella cryptocerci]QBO35991.1 hypothetical protein EQG49_05710 [Periweissella cryptocerci]
MKKEHTRKFAMMAIILISTIMLTGCGAKLAGDAGNNAEVAQSTKNVDDEQTEVAKYEGILQAARTLTDSGSFEESNAQLNTMSVTELGKPAFKDIKDAVDVLRQTNTDGVAAAQKAKAAKKAAKATKKANATANAVAAPTATYDISTYPEFTGNFSFISGDADRSYYSMSIAGDGYVTQETDGSTYYGRATIVSQANSGILSYDVTNIDYADDYYPTKYVQKAYVKLVVSWDEGGSDTYYGYQAWDGRAVLTDGDSYGDGVDEVWIK